jgi:hypothetical protein
MSGTALRHDDGLVGEERVAVKRNPAEAGLKFGDDLSGKRDTSSGRGTPFIYHPRGVALVILLTQNWMGTDFPRFLKTRAAGGIEVGGAGVRAAGGAKRRPRDRTI